MSLEVVILVGLPGAGKSTFYAQRFAATHRQVSKDLLRSRHDLARRQVELIAAALAAGAPVVVDDTNASRAERAPAIAAARAAGARVVGYFFDCAPRDCALRNAGRTGRARVPNVAIFTTAKRLERPDVAEGFDVVHVVTPRPGPAFDVDGA